MEFSFGGNRYLVSWQHFDDTAEATLPSGKVRQSVAGVMHGLLEGHWAAKVPHKVLPDGTLTPKLSRVVDGKRVRYNGLTICRIKTMSTSADNPDIAPADKWFTVSEGYAFKRDDEPAFDKGQGRKRSLADAVKGLFNHDARENIWAKFHLIWPPVNPDATIWERRYVRLKQEHDQMVKNYQQILEEAKKAKAEA